MIVHSDMEYLPGKNIVGAILLSVIGGTGYSSVGLKRQMLIWAMFCVIYIVAYVVGETLTGRLIVSGVVTAIVFTCQILFAFYNKKASKVQAASDGDSDTLTEQEEEDHNEQEKPDGIPDALWLQRSKLYDENGLLSEEQAGVLLTSGWFSSDDVIRLYTHLQANNVSRPPSPKEPPPEVHVNELPRQNALQIVLSGVLAFVATYLWSRVSSVSEVSGVVKVVASMSASTGIFSLLFPLHTEAYSTTVDDQQNRFTRCFYTSIFSILCGLFGHIGYSFSAKMMIWAVMLLPVVITTGCLPQISTFAWWLAEWVLRYWLGMSGLIWKDISVYVSLLVYASLTLVYALCEESVLLVVVCVGAAVLLLNLRFSVYAATKSVIAGVLSGALFYVSIRYTQKYRHEIALVCIIYGLIFDIVVPFCCGNTCRLLVFMKLIESHVVFTMLRLVSPLVIVPFLLGSFWSDDLPFYVKAALVVHIVNRGYIEPHVIPLALVIAEYVFGYDWSQLDLNNHEMLRLFVSLMIAKKFVHVWILFDREMQRRGVYKIDLGGSIRVKLSFVIVRKLTSIFGEHVNFVPLLWSFITGSPLCNKFGMSRWSTLGFPRHGAFWDHVRTKEKISKSHQIETLVYLPLKTWLAENLISLIKSSELGVVNEDTFLVFKSPENGIVICHIIALSNDVVYFQLRGAEVQDTTLCHEHETSWLTALSEFHFFRKFNPELMGFALAAGYRPLSAQVVIPSYKPYSVDVKQAFIGMSTEDRLLWIAVSMFYMACKIWDSNYHLELKAPLETDNMTNYELLASIFDKCSTETGRIVKEDDFRFLFKIASVLAATYLGDLDKPSIIFGSFEDPMRSLDAYLDFISGVSNGEDVVKCGWRFAIVVLYLVSAGIAPELEDVDGVFEFLQETDEEYVRGPLRSQEVQGALGSMNVITMSDRNYKLLNIMNSSVTWSIFKLSGEIVKGMWETDSKLCLFWKWEATERPTIQAHGLELHNLITQVSDLPEAHPVYVTEVLSSSYNLSCFNLCHK